MMTEDEARTKDNYVTGFYLGLAVLFCCPLITFGQSFGQLAGMILAIAAMMLIPLSVLLMTIISADALTSRSRQKPKPFEPTIAQDESLNPELDYALGDDGELVELHDTEETPKQQHNSHAES